MEKSIVDCLKVFLEKYFILSVMAVVLTFITFLAVSSDLFIIRKLGNTMFSVFSFCVWFLILVLFKFILNNGFKLFYAQRNKKCLRKIHKEERLKMNKNVLEGIWTHVDSMSTRDYELLMDFVINGNKPYVASGFFCGNSLLNSGWVHKTLFKEDEKISSSEEVLPNLNVIPYCIPVQYQYILKEDIYQILKYSQDKYGRISHFNG